MSTSRHYRSHVRQTTEPIINLSQLPEDVLTIKFKLYRCESSWNITDQDDDEDVIRVLHEQQIQLETEELILVYRSEMLSDDDSHRTTYKTLITVALSSMDVPETEHHSIIWKVFRVVKSALPGVPILVDFYDVSCVSDDQSDMIDEVTRESMETNEDYPIPATKSFVENLEKVRACDDLEGTIHKSCVICMEGFDGFEAGVDELIRLPCSHLYHKHCIVQWLETSHLCPLCRYAMPHDH